MPFTKIPFRTTKVVNTVIIIVNISIRSIKLISECLRIKPAIRGDIRYFAEPAN